MTTNHRDTETGVGEKKHNLYFTCCNPKIVATFPHDLGNICAAFTHIRVNCAKRKVFYSGDLFLMMFSLMIYSQNLGDGCISADI